MQKNGSRAYKLNFVKAVIKTTALKLPRKMVVSEISNFIQTCFLKWGLTFGTLG